MTSFAPQTLAIAQQISAYLTAMVYTSGVNIGNPVYTSGEIGVNKDISDLLPANGTNAYYEVIASSDDSTRHALGGKMRDTQSFIILSMVDFTNGAAAETQIMNIRDAIMPQFAKHAALENAGNVLLAKYKPNSGRFTHVIRAAKTYRAHSMEVSVISEWSASVTGGFIA